MIEQLVERSFHRATRKQHIVDEDDVRAVHIGGNLSGDELLWNRMPADVVPVKRDIQNSNLHGAGSVAIAKLLTDSPGEFDAAVGDSQ